MSLEYRVRWRREGSDPRYLIRQTLQGAQRKAQGILAVEAVKHDTTLDDMPDLVEGPVIQVREVGEWVQSIEEPLQPTEATLDRVKALYAPDPETSSYGPF